MYTKEQKERALKEFERLGSVQATVTYLGYPSRHIVYLTRKNEKQISCHPSLKKIGNAFGINKNTVLKYVRSLEDKELIRTYPTKVFTKSGKVQNGNLRYVLLPVENAFRIYQEEKFKKVQKELAKIRFQNAIKSGKKIRKTG